MRNPYRNLFGALTVMGLAYAYANRARFKQLAENLELDVYIRQFLDGFQDGIRSNTFDTPAEWNAFIDEAMSFMEESQKETDKDDKTKKYIDSLLERIKTLENRVTN